LHGTSRAYISGELSPDRECHEGVRSCLEQNATDNEHKRVEIARPIKAVADKAVAARKPRAEAADAVKQQVVTKAGRDNSAARETTMEPIVTADHMRRPNSEPARRKP
jgi:hypothetical protein